jgi:hypothetical protein
MAKSALMCFVIACGILLAIGCDRYSSDRLDTIMYLQGVKYLEKTFEIPNVAKDKYVHIWQEHYIGGKKVGDTKAADSGSGPWKVSTILTVHCALRELPGYPGTIELALNYLIDSGPHFTKTECLLTEGEPDRHRIWSASITRGVSKSQSDDDQILVVVYRSNSEYKDFDPAQLRQLIEKGVEVIVMRIAFEESNPMVNASRKSLLR